MFLYFMKMNFTLQMLQVIKCNYNLNHFKYLQSQNPGYICNLQEFFSANLTREKLKPSEHWGNLCFSRRYDSLNVILKFEGKTDSTEINTMEYNTSLEIYDSVHQLLWLVSSVETDIHSTMN